MATHVCVVGSVNMDLVMQVAALPVPGETVRAASVLHAPGGKGANQAIAAARAGALVRFVGAVGDDDAGAELLRHLADNGVGTAGVLTVPGPSGAAVVTVDEAGENTIVIAAGANHAVNIEAARAEMFITDCDVLLLQLEIPLPVAVAAARIARSAGAVVILNASPAGGNLTELASLTDVVVLNESEAAHWAWPATHRVITLGARGARYLAADTEFSVPAPAVAARDTTGAGDVFAGVLAASWVDGPEYAVRRACAAGALATLRPGAGDCAPTSVQIEAILNP